MRFKQFKDLLDDIVTGRRHLQKLYRRQGNYVDSERSRMLLNYLADKQQEQGDSLASYLETAPEGVRDTWFENAYDNDVLGRIDRTCLAADANPSQVMELALDLDSRLLRLLEKNIEASPSAEVTQAMSNLINHEQQFQRRLTLSAERLEDI